ncbi:hypothetical protein [Streptosporangium vulgare]|uniref:hypothetical protein n=1 Tax=Streptosporangium vulgare TaxID=46190 RepID=UPI0031D79C23
MARHDREESLEEQLAWLDAIKEQEEEAPALAAKGTAVDDAVVSPYPKDPWSLVPTEPDATSSPLFRAAVDSAHPATDTPVEDADAADWMEASDTVSSFTVPAPASGKQDNDGFLAPLKPLPRQEQADTGDHGHADFTEPHLRTPFAAPAQEPSRGLFEQPQRPAEPAAPASAEAPDLEPHKPSSSDTERFTFGSTDFGGTDSDRFSFGSGGTRSTSGGHGLLLDQRRLLLRNLRNNLRSLRNRGGRPVPVRHVRVRCVRCVRGVQCVRPWRPLPRRRCRARP